MTAVQVGKSHFTGSSKVFGTDPEALANIIRKLAIDNARLKLLDSDLADFTDSSTGVASRTAVNLVLPSAVYDATSAGGAQRAAFNTAIGKFENAAAVMAQRLNIARSRVGLPVLSWASGTISSAGTLPAMDKSVASATGTSALDYATGLAAMKSAKENMLKLVRAANQVFTAVGWPVVTNAMTGEYGSDYALSAVSDADASASGASAIAKTVADTFLDTLADNIATLASNWNEAMSQTATSDLTDNSGGSSAGDTVAEVPSEFTAHQDGVTDSAPVAGFNTELAKISNNFADLAEATNHLRLQAGLAPITDNSGGTADGTLEVIDDTLTAVDGGTDSTLSKATADVTFVEMTANIATLVGAINSVVGVAGVTALTDNSGGTASSTDTLVALTDGSGVDNGAAATGTSKAEVDASLDAVTDAMATMVAKLNEMLGADSDPYPLGVVAV